MCLLNLKVLISGLPLLILTPAARNLTFGFFHAYHVIGNQLTSPQSLPFLDCVVPVIRYLNCTASVVCWEGSTALSRSFVMKAGDW